MDVITGSVGTSPSLFLQELKNINETDKRRRGKRKILLLLFIVGGFAID
jgi:hypothetical protein